MKKYSILGMIIGMLVVGCQPPETIIQTAIAETEKAAPTLTSTFVPTSTSTFTPSPTLDLRVIKLDPPEFLLSETDLPSEGKYYLPNSGWMTPHHNEEIIQQMGAEKGKKYINDTGRIDGWIVTYLRGAKNVSLPLEIYDNVIMYQTAEGAQIAIEKYAVPDGYVKVEMTTAIGDLSKIYTLKKDGNIFYDVQFAHKNYIHVLKAYGLEAEVRPGFVEEIALMLLDRLESAPLSPP